MGSSEEGEDNFRASEEANSSLMKGSLGVVFAGEGRGGLSFADEETPRSNGGPAEMRYEHNFPKKNKKNKNFLKSALRYQRQLQQK